MKKRAKNYQGKYLGKLTPASSIRFGSALMGAGAGLSIGGGIGAIGGWMVGDYAAKKGLKKLFKKGGK